METCDSPSPVILLDRRYNSSAPIYAVPKLTLSSVRDHSENFRMLTTSKGAVNVATVAANGLLVVNRTDPLTLLVSVLLSHTKF